MTAYRREYGPDGIANFPHSGIVEGRPLRLSIRLVAEPDTNRERAEAGMALPSDALPPIIDPLEIPPPLPLAPRRGPGPWVIVALCAGGMVALLALGLLTVGLLIAGNSKRKGGTEVRTAISPRKFAGAVATEIRDLRSDSGVIYSNVTIASVPWSIHVLKIERSRQDLSFYAAHARGKVLGVSLIAEQARDVPREMGGAIAGVNGDFYVRDDPTYAGDPRGLQIVNRELISAPDTWSVWFDAEGNPHLGEVQADFNVTWPDGRKNSLRPQ
jgi:hypothetical protein